MAFGITKEELEQWKMRVSEGKISYLTHYWVEPRFPDIRTITKVGCSDIALLKKWCHKHGLNDRYIHMRERYPHFDLIGPKQKEILMKENLWDHIERFNL